MLFVIISMLLLVLTIVEDKKLFKISFFFVTVFNVSTFAYGYDWMNYYDTFLAVQTGTVDTFFTEPGYLFLMEMANYIGLNFAQFSGCVTLIMYLAIYSFCKKMDNPNLAFFTLYSFLSFFMFTEQIRQGLALCILLFGVTYLYNNNIKKFTIIVLIACLFHISAIIALLFLFIKSSSGKGIYKFTIVSSVFVIALLYSLYHPDLFGAIPLIGPKIEAYSRLSEEKDVGFWQYVLSSRLVFIFSFLYIFLLILRKRERSLYAGIGSVFVLLLSRLSPYLVRVGYYFVPYLVISVDKYMSSQGRGLHSRLNKLIYITIIYLVSTIPAWNPVYWEGSKTFLTIASDTTDINNEISRKCSILKENYDHIVIMQCL